MFKIKICGITNLTDAAAVAAAGADAVGLNFYARSPRYVEPPLAKVIAQSLPPGICKVGLFVNHSPTQIRQLFEQVGLDLIQLHGDETPADVAELRGLPVLKAFRAEADLLSQVLRYVEACQQAAAPLTGVLVDAYQPGSYGGTGAKADWPTASALREQLGDLPLILAGGLTPANVAEALLAVRPYGVDTASGVESSPGCKDAQRVQQFVAAALLAAKG
ncbi:MAG TPA: phosphoribosylanthranilate isomerase [Pirellulaceae bacterium]|nr:phosphoribosylanthranilate isomerase [Pirellulaceae bacterium]